MFYIHIQDLLVFLDSVPKGILDEILALLLEEWFPEVQSLSVHSKNSLACSLMARLCSLYSQPAIWSQWFFSCWLPSKSLSLTLSGHGAKFSFSSLDSTNPVIVFLSDFDFNGSFAWTFFGGNHSHKLRAWGVSSDNNNIVLSLFTTHGENFQEKPLGPGWPYAGCLSMEDWSIYQLSLGQHVEYGLISGFSRRKIKIVEEKC